MKMKFMVRSLFFVSGLSIVSGCAMFSDREEGGSEQDSTAQVSPVSAPLSNEQGSKDHVITAAPVPVSAKSATASHSTSHHEEKVGVEPEVALKWLQNGNVRFTKNRRRTDGASAADRIRLAKGQSPHTIIVSCADSRVPPEHIFDQALGEIFVVRGAGQALDTTAIASVEYAIAHLGARLIVVMGHDSCGAVKASATTPVGQSVGSPSLDALAKDIRARLPSSTAAGFSENFVVEGKSNAKGVAADLVARSSIVREAVESGKVKISSALYYLKSGKVEFF